MVAARNKKKGTTAKTSFKEKMKISPIRCKMCKGKGIIILSVC